MKSKESPEVPGEMSAKELSIALANYFRDHAYISVELAKALKTVQGRLLDDELDEIEEAAKWLKGA